MVPRNNTSRWFYKRAYVVHTKHKNDTFKRHFAIARQPNRAKESNLFFSKSTISGGPKVIRTHHIHKNPCIPVLFTNLMWS